MVLENAIRCGNFREGLPVRSFSEGGPRRLTVRTPFFQDGNTGSIPVGVTGMSDDQMINRDMISYYRDRAGEYDRNAYSEERQRARQPDIQKSAAVLQNIFSDKRVLEIAAGTGFWTERIAETAMSVTATDINKNAIDLAKKKSYTKANVTFSVADMYMLGDLPPYDALFGGFIFSHVLREDWRKFIDTINSYVIPAGVVVLMDNRFLVPNPNDRTDERDNNYRLRTLENGSKHEVVKNYPTERELRDLLQDRATNIDFRNLEHYWLLIYRTLST